MFIYNSQQAVFFCLLRSDQILLYKIKKLGIGIENLINLFQLSGNWIV